MQHSQACYNHYIHVYIYIYTYISSKKLLERLGFTPNFQVTTQLQSSQNNYYRQYSINTFHNKYLLHEMFELEDQNSLDISPRLRLGLISWEFWSYIVDIHSEAMVYILHISIYIYIIYMYIHIHTLVLRNYSQGLHQTSKLLHNCSLVKIITTGSIVSTHFIINICYMRCLNQRNVLCQGQGKEFPIFLKIISFNKMLLYVTNHYYIYNTTQHFILIAHLSRLIQCNDSLHMYDIMYSVMIAYICII